MAKKQCLCPIPFHQVFIQSSGKVYPCAFLQNHTLLGDVKDRPLTEILNGKEYLDFKKKHLNQEYSQCQKNQDIFACHKTLKGYEFPKEDPLHHPVSRLDFMIDSHCNLKCIMCTNVYEERGGFEEDSFWEDFAQNILPNLHELELIGGEPLIIPHTFKTLDLIKKINPKCRIKVTTNGAYRLGKKVKDALSQINLVNLGYSIDSLKEDVFRTIRPGGELKQVLETLDDLIVWREEEQLSFNFEVNFVVQKLNAFEVPSFLQFVRAKGLIPYLIFLNHPLDHSLLNTSSEEQQKIIQFYLEDFKRSKDPELAKLILTMFKKLDRIGQANLANDILSLNYILQG